MVGVASILNFLLTTEFECLASVTNSSFFIDATGAICDVVHIDKSRVGDDDVVAWVVADTSTLFDAIDDVRVIGDPGFDSIGLQIVDAEDIGGCAPN